MNKQNLFFLLYTNCIPVKGKQTSLIYDLQKGLQTKIPNLLYDVLAKSKLHTITNLKKKFDNKYDEGIDSYFNLLHTKGLGFFTTEPHSFPPLKTEYHSNTQLNYCLIELGENNISLIASVVEQLNSIGVKYLQIRDIRQNPLQDYEKILESISKKKGIIGVDIYVKHFDSSHIQKAKKIAVSIKHISNITILNSPEVQTIKISSHSRKSHILLVKKDFNTFFTEKLSPKYFSCNILAFVESNNRNLGLNSKICINEAGEVKNFFDHSLSFGTIFKDSIENILKTTNIKKQWEIPKFKIQNCKTCIYRYCCTFSSEVELINDKYNLKQACNYDQEHDKWLD